MPKHWRVDPRYASGFFEGGTGFHPTLTAVNTGAGGDNVTVDGTTGALALNVQGARQRPNSITVGSPAGGINGINGRIDITGPAEDGDVIVSVRDTGIGISAAMLPQVFRMFAQADKDHKRDQGGLGIGLSLAKSLVEMQGGRIEAHSDGEGRGSEFVVRLPLAERQRIPLKNDSRSDRLENRISTRDRILVVDDNRDAADTLAALLRKLGNEIKTANNGPTALEAIQAFSPSVVLLDLGMPGMSGYEVARRARDLPGGQECILVAVTGWGQQDDRRRTKEAGFDHHLVKPVEIAVLQDLISEIQDGKTMMT
jgi:CheY-like chemotaxis protein